MTNLDPTNLVDPPTLSYANPAIDRRANRFALEFHGNFSLQLCGLLLVVAVLIALLLPPTSRGGRTARVVCMSNLRQISIALHLYAAEHAGCFPPTIAEVLEYTGQRSASVFVCPVGHAATTRADTPAELKHDLLDPAGRYCSYVLDLPGARKSSITAQHVVAHEYLGGHPWGGINVAFGDGVIRGFDGAEATHLLAELRAGRNPPKPFNASAR
jgi:hypothetical protein